MDAQKRTALIKAFREASDFERRFGNRADPEILTELERRWGSVVDQIAEYGKHGKQRR